MVVNVKALNVKTVADPYSTSSSSVDAKAGLSALSLRDADWSETGPDAFFLVVNGVVALFAAAVWLTGALPTPASVALLEPVALARIAGVNWAIMAAAYGGYHWAFFGGGFAKLFNAAPTKFNPAPYDKGQLTREVALTTLSMLFGSCYTALAWWGAGKGLWLGGRLPDANDFQGGSGFLFTFCASFILLGLWSDFHFYIVHRALHVPFLFKNVHRVHHLSKNPGPWSGLSMHPVETITYLSKVLLPLIIPSFHPVHFLFMLYNATLMPIPGHSGHEELLGNEYHWIHHHTYLHNYGSPAVPLDKLFGSHKLLPKAEKEVAVGNKKE